METHAQDELLADGTGVEQDSVRAYAWLNLSANRGDEDGEADRDSLAETMTPEQISQAKALSGELDSSIKQ